MSRHTQGEWCGDPVPPPANTVLGPTCYDGDGKKLSWGDLKMLQGDHKGIPPIPRHIKFKFYELLYHWVMEISGEEPGLDGVGRAAGQMVTFLYAYNKLMCYTG